jgi:hypothetical protein
MQTNSSTSASERAFIRSAIAAFACTLALLLLPYEALVRRSEHLYGRSRANIVVPRTLSPKVDVFIADLNAGVHYPVLAVGTSRVEASIRPDILDPYLGPMYNLGLGGSSSIATLEFVERLGLRPERLIVGVSPMDFTPLGIRRGEKGIARTRESLHVGGSQHDAGRGPAAWCRAATYSLIHAATPERRRNLGQWLELLRDRGFVLAFLNNEDATGALGGTSTHGYAPLVRIAAPDQIGQGEWGNIPAEYVSGRPTLFPRLAAVLLRFRARGADVTLVRIPTSIGVRRSEDVDTHFDEDIQVFSRQFAIRYIDGLTLVGPAFASDRRNFSDTEHVNATGALRFSRVLAIALADGPSNRSR